MLIGGQTPAQAYGQGETSAGRSTAGQGPRANPDYEAFHIISIPGLAGRLHDILGFAWPCKNRSAGPCQKPSDRRAGMCTPYLKILFPSHAHSLQHGKVSHATHRPELLCHGTQEATATISSSSHIRLSIRRSMLASCYRQLMRLWSAPLPAGQHYSKQPSQRQKFQQPVQVQLE